MVSHLLSKRKTIPLTPSDTNAAPFPFDAAQALKRLGVLARIDHEDSSDIVRSADGERKGVVDGDGDDEEEGSDRSPDQNDAQQPFCVRHFTHNALALFDIIADSELP
jgi:hypothetical protein